MKRIAALTSGGDAPGMNAPFGRLYVRRWSVGSRSTLSLIGYQGMAEGGKRIRKMD